MGQYYHPVILDAEGKVLVWMDAYSYDNGQKLMEHSFLGNTFVSTFEYGLSPDGMYNKSPVVWAGDYAKEEPGKDKNLHHMCNEYNLIRPAEKNTTCYRFIVNHSKQLYVDKWKVPNVHNVFLHPLSLLTAEGNGLSGGDYHGPSKLVGSWARDILSVEYTLPEGFQELVFDLV
jgi:hypothetical protein